MQTHPMELLQNNIKAQPDSSLVFGICLKGETAFIERQNRCLKLFIMLPEIRSQVVIQNFEESGKFNYTKIPNQIIFRQFQTPAKPSGGFWLFLKFQSLQEKFEENKLWVVGKVNGSPYVLVIVKF